LRQTGIGKGGDRGNRPNGRPGHARLAFKIVTNAAQVNGARRHIAQKWAFIAGF
jgi:hypothetical protein